MTLNRGDLSLVTVAEAARLADVEPRTIRNWIDRYGLTRHRIDGRVYLSEREVLECERDRHVAGHRWGRRRGSS